jgi:hypothetical protein
MPSDQGQKFCSKGTGSFRSVCGHLGGMSTTASPVSLSAFGHVFETGRGIGLSCLVTASRRGAMRLRVMHGRFTMPRTLRVSGL